MQRGRSVAGLPVIVISRGEMSARIKEVAFDPKAERIVAFLAELPGETGQPRAILFDDVIGVGKDAVMVSKIEALVPLAERPQVEEALAKGRMILRNTIFTKGGDRIGTIDDVVFDQKTGRVLGYEVSGGIFKDLYRGKSMIDAPDILSIGPDAVIVPDELEQAIEAEAGGWQAYYGEKVDAASEAILQQEREFVVGRITGRDVFDQEGKTLIPKGTVITDEVVALAEDAGKIHQLALAAGLTTAISIYESLRERAGQVIETSRWGQGRKAPAPTVAPGEELVEPETPKLTPAEEGLAHEMLGRMASDSVLDDQGLPVIIAGDEVTPATIDRAVAAGKLKELEDSVRTPTRETGTE